MQSRGKPCELQIQILWQLLDRRDGRISSGHCSQFAHLQLHNPIYRRYLHECRYGPNDHSSVQRSLLGIHAGSLHWINYYVTTNQKLPSQTYLYSRIIATPVTAFFFSIYQVILVNHITTIKQFYTRYFQCIFNNI